MPRQMADYFNRGIVDRGQALAKLDERLGLDLLNQVDQNIAEHADLLLIETVSLIEE